MCGGLHYVNAGRFYSHDVNILPYVVLQVIIYTMFYFICYILTY
jgi:hypothetical protein